MVLKSLSHLTPNGKNRIERGHWLLEDHGNVLATQGPHPSRRKAAYLTASYHDVAVNSRIARKQSESGHGRDRLARTRFAHQGNDLPGLYVNRDSAHCMDTAELRLELHVEIIEGQYRLSGVLIDDDGCAVVVHSTLFVVLVIPKEFEHHLTLPF